MKKWELPLGLPNLRIDRIITGQSGLEICGHLSSRAANCPDCGRSSGAVHSYYQRILKDLSISEHTVQLVIRVRRFRCQNPNCQRQTFVEPLTGIAPGKARRTRRLTEVVRTIGLAVGGQAGQRLTARLRLRASADTILRIIRQTPLPAANTPKVLGVDDWAIRRGRTYGTILVDLEQRRPIDLLPDRTADIFAQWLKVHPGIEIISRDRSVEYTLAANLSAPQAQQVADRWHLLKNLREALERTLTRLRPQFSQIPAAPSSASSTTDRRPQRLRPPSESELLQQGESRAVRYRRYQAVRLLLARGLSERAISRVLNLTRHTVHKYATTETFPERAVLRPQTSILDAYLPYLRQQVRAGTTNARQLWREIKAQGYPGAYQQVSRVVRYYRDPVAQVANRAPTSSLIHLNPPVALGPLPSARELVWLLLRPTEDLTAAEQTLFSQLRQHPHVETAYQLTRQFQTMLRLRQADTLQAWLDACRASDLPDLQTFAVGLQREFPSIYRAFAGPWSNERVSYCTSFAF